MHILNDLVIASIQGGPLLGCSRIRGPKSSSSLKHVIHILQGWIWHSYILEDLKKEEDLKKYINYVTHPMGFTDIIIVHQKSATFIISKNVDTVCILIDNF